MNTTLSLPNEMLYYAGNKALIKNANNDVFLLKIKQNDYTYWDLPGGRINRGETVEQALRREVQEETGITDLLIGKHLGMALSEVQIPITPEQKGGLIFSVYACSSTTLSDLDLKAEAGMEIVWCPASKVTEWLEDFPAELLEKIDSELARYIAVT